MRRRLARGLAMVLLGGVLGYFTHSLRTSTKPNVFIFDDKRYFEYGDYVYVAGSRTGAGVAYPDNTMAIGCFKDRMECWTASVEGISKDSCQIGRLDSPSYMPITKWTDQEIIAAQEGSCSKTTLSIARGLKTVVFVDEPVNVTSAFCAGARTEIEKSTLENSRWKSLMFGKEGQ